MSTKGREQYEWAERRIAEGLEAIRLDRMDVAQWLDRLANDGHFSRRGLEIFRNVLKAALNDAVDEGLIRRNPAARVALPRNVAKPARIKEANTWSEAEVARFLAVASKHRWAARFRLAVLYGLRRSELLALRWDDVDARAGTIRIDEGLVPIGKGVEWSPGKTARSRRTGRSR